MKRLIQILIAILTVFTLTFCQMNNKSEGFTKSSDGTEISYSYYGKGKELILFVHGWSCDKSYWDNQVEYFRKDYQVVTIDLGGHGKSGLGRKEWTMSSFGDDVISVLKEFKYETAYLVGHSMGANVIVEAGSKLNSNNIELLLVDRFKNDLRPMNEEKVDRFSKPFENDFANKCKEWVKGNLFINDSNPELIEWISNDMSQANPEVALSAFRYTLLHDIKPSINNLNERGISMTVINSDYKKTNSENLLELGFKIEIMTNTGHFIMMETPDQFNEKVHELINQ
jgi:pimeloyl-ACP methyl ester carboxylesterase